MTYSDIGVGRTPGYASVCRFLHDRRPYGVPDRVGLFRLTCHGELKPPRTHYSPVETFSGADTCKRGQRSVDSFFATTTHALASETKEGEQIQIIGRTIKFRKSKYFSRT